MSAIDLARVKVTASPRPLKVACMISADFFTQHALSFEVHPAQPAAAILHWSEGGLFEFCCIGGYVGAVAPTVSVFLCACVRV